MTPDVAFRDTSHLPPSDLTGAAAELGDAATRERAASGRRVDVRGSMLERRTALKDAIKQLLTGHAAAWGSAGAAQSPQQLVGLLRSLTHRSTAATAGAAAAAVATEAHHSW